MFFWNSLAFSMIQQMLAIWSLVHLPFLEPAWTSGSSQFTYCWSLAWRILSITLLACEMSAIVHSVSILWHCLFCGLEWKLVTKREALLIRIVTKRMALLIWNKIDFKSKKVTRDKEEHYILRKGTKQQEEQNSNIINCYL